MAKTKSQASYIKSNPWVKPSKKSENHAYSLMCLSEINVSVGVTELQLHEKAKKAQRCC